MQLKDKTVRDVALRCRWMSVSLLILVLSNLFYIFSNIDVLMDDCKFFFFLVLSDLFG